MYALYTLSRYLYPCMMSIHLIKKVCSVHFCVLINIEGINLSDHKKNEANIDSIDSIDSAASYHHGHLRDALMAEGLKLIESTQSTDFSLRELTRTLGVTVNAAYRHFASKEDLLCAIATHGFTQLLIQQAQAIQQSDHPIQGFLKAGRTYIDFAQQNPTLFRLMFSRFSAQNASVEMAGAAQLAYDGIRFSLAAALTKDVNDAEVTVGSAHAWSIIHGLSYLVIDRQLEPHANNIDQLINDIMQQAFYSMLNTTSHAS